MIIISVVDILAVVLDAALDSLREVEQMSRVVCFG